jgi:hypothetical protein
MLDSTVRLLPLLLQQDVEVCGKVCMCVLAVLTVLPKQECTHC